MLSNNRLFIVNYLNDGINDLRKCITIHDENYNLIKKVEKINGKFFTDIKELAINQEKGEVYISECYSDRIIVTDFELNFIKYFFGWIGEDHLNSPYGICFKNGYLYVADGENNRIQIFNQDLEYIESLKLEYEPFQVQVTNSLLAVTSKDGIFLYELINLELYLKHENEALNGLHLSEIDSVIFGFGYKNKEIVSIDLERNLLEQIKMNEKDLKTEFDGKLVLFNKSLLTSSYEGKKLIKFKSY